MNNIAFVFGPLLLIICMLVPALTFVPPPEDPMLTVETMQVPHYPPLARASGIDGVVEVKVATDGSRAIDTQVQSGHKLLAGEAEANVQTWRFSAHDATNFKVTYRYRLVESSTDDPPGRPTVILRLPGYVEVRSVALVISDPAPEIGD